MIRATLMLWDTEERVLLRMNGTIVSLVAWISVSYLKTIPILIGLQNCYILPIVPRQLTAAVSNILRTPIFFLFREVVLL